MTPFRLTSGLVPCRTYRPGLPAGYFHAGRTGCITGPAGGLPVPVWVPVTFLAQVTVALSPGGPWLRSLFGSDPLPYRPIAAGPWRRSLLRGDRCACDDGHRWRGVSHYRPGRGQAGTRPGSRQRRSGRDPATVRRSIFIFGGLGCPGGVGFTTIQKCGVRRPPPFGYC